jgi:hypothetical protein
MHNRACLAGTAVDGVIAIGDCATAARDASIAQSDAIFDAFDTNKNGDLDQAEFDAALKSLTANLRHDSHASRFFERVTERAKVIIESAAPFDKAAFKAVLDSADAVTRDLPATAAVAAQQGTYIGKMISKEFDGVPSFGQTNTQFEFKNLGQLVCTWTHPT